MRVSIFGTGYVGLVTGACLAEVGNEVVCVDIDAGKVAALRRGEVISRTALYEHIFDETDDSMSNLVDVHIFSLRRKLGADVIATRRGQGYEIPG